MRSPRSSRLTADRPVAAVKHLLDGLPKARLPSACTAPMLATLGVMPTRLDAFGYEVKWDGYRALARWDGTALSLCSRNGIDLLPRFAEIAPLRKALRQPTVLDGELVALDRNGHPSFSALQTRMPHARGLGSLRTWDPQRFAVQFMVFDILHHAGASTCALPYTDRRVILESLSLSGVAWQVPPAHPDGPELLKVMQRAGQEGIIAKRLSSPYLIGRRSPDWIKIKISRQDAFMIVGFWSSGASALGSLLLAAHANASDARERRLPRFCGKVGTGFSNQDREQLHRALLPLQSDKPQAEGRLPRGPGITWCRPRLVAQVRFSEWTHDGHLRHPAFIGLRSDLDPHDVILADSEEGP